MRFYCEHPLVLGGIVLVAINDHWAKYSFFAGFLTGKVSDFAGLFFFPFLLMDILSLVRRAWHRSEIIFISALVLVGVLFTTLKISSYAVSLYQQLYGSLGIRVAVVRDLTDLSALIMLPLALLWHRKLRGYFHEA